MKKLMLLILLLMTGCVNGLLTPHGRVIPIKHRGSLGTGFVVGRHLVLTVAHVHGEGTQTWACDGMPAKLVENIPSPGGWENLVLLKTQGVAFAEEDIFRVRHGDPTTVWTQDGPHPVDNSQIIPGHSGSPAVDADGFAVAAVSARRCSVCSADDRGRELVVLPGQETVLSPIPEGWSP